jgi:tRNA nucleotidyltransferase (CCA-adding enzyme)
MSEIDRIFSEVLKEIKPTANELVLIKKITEKLKELLRKKAHELDIQYTTIEPQGSTGIKQTQLRNDFDIDLFIGLDYELYKSKYTKLSKRKLKKNVKEEFLWLCNNWIKSSLSSKEFQNPRLLYAEHPYIQVDYIIEDVNIEIDIVLYFDLDLEFIKLHGPITAVDRTPWHGKFVRDNLTSKQKDEVRLLKQFFKASHSYGDTSPVGRIGFIGYSAELLIYHYKDLLSVFQNFNLLPKNPLDYFQRDKEKLRKIPHFQNDHLIITDPIDKNRNVASAISEKAYKYCNFRINQFLKRPNTKFFEIEEIPEFNPREAPKIASQLYIIEFINTDKNVHYTEIRDKLYSLASFIITHGEKELDHESKFGEIVFEVYFIPKIQEYNLALYCENPEISKFYERRGPPQKQKKHAEKFKQKHDNSYVKNDFLWVKTKREYTTFLNFLKSIINKRTPENLRVNNLSNSLNVKSTSAKQALHVLNTMVLPFN